MFARQVRVCVAVACVSIASACRSTYRMPVEQGATLTESLALEASRAAIANAGYDAGRAVPVCYWHRCDPASPYLARNDRDPSRGYTLWRLADRKDRAWHLFVRLQLRADALDCAVSEAH